MSSFANQRTVGFAIGTASEEFIRLTAAALSNDDRHEFDERGWLDAGKKITPKGWDLLNEDIRKLERNALKWLRDTFESAVDHGHGGHSGDELVGNVVFDVKSKRQAEIIRDGQAKEILGMGDDAFGLHKVAWKGVSAFGKALLAGYVEFFGVDEIVVDEIDATLAAAKRRRRPR